MSFALDDYEFAWKIVEGPARDLVLAQLADIGRIPWTERPVLPFQLDSGESTQVRALGLLCLDGMRGLENNPGDMWQFEGYADGELGGQYARGIFDTRFRIGGIDVVTAPREILLVNAYKKHLA